MISRNVISIPSPIYIHNYLEWMASVAVRQDFNSHSVCNFSLRNKESGYKFEVSVLTVNVNKLQTRFLGTLILLICKGMLLWGGTQEQVFDNEMKTRNCRFVDSRS
jgi:hypothetical protein